MQPGGHPLLLLLACPLILADGLPFDTELYPPSLEQAHNLISKEQLLHMFGVQEAHMVDHTRWDRKKAAIASYGTILAFHISVVERL